MSTLIYLPYEIKKYEILPKIDAISRIVLRHVFLFEKFPYRLNEQTQEDLAQYHPTFINLFHSKYLLDEEFPDYIAQKGNIDAMKWAKDNGYDFTVQTIANAAENGDMELIKWLRLNGCPWNGTTAYFGARAGIGILRYLYENNCPMDRRVCHTVTDLECLKYIRENMTVWDKSASTAYHLARKGKLDCLKYAYENGCQLGEQVADISAANGHLHILKWLHEIKYAYMNSIYREAAERGHFDILKWAYDIGYKIDSHDCEGAVDGANLGVMKWLRQRGASWQLWRCRASELPNPDRHYECLQYAIGDGCPWDNDSAVTAAAHGHLKCLAYFHSRGATITGEAFNEAIASRHFDCLQYMYEADMHNMRRYLTKHKVCEIACTDNVDMFEWAIKTTKFDPCIVLEHVAYNGCVNVLNLCHKNGVSIDPGRLSVIAAGSGRLDIIRWMLFHFPFDIRRVCLRALIEGEERIIKWINRHKLA